MKLYDVICCGRRTKKNIYHWVHRDTEAWTLEWKIGPDCSFGTLRGLNLKDHWLAPAERGCWITEEVGELDCDQEEKHYWGFTRLCFP